MGGEGHSPLSDPSPTGDGGYPIPTLHPLGDCGTSTPPILKSWVRHWELELGLRSEASVRVIRRSDNYVRCVRCGISSHRKITTTHVLQAHSAKALKRTKPIGIGDDGHVLPFPPPKKKKEIREKIFCGQISRKIRHFVNFSCIIFGQKCLAPPQLSLMLIELLRL